MTKFSISNLALAGALALGLGTAMAVAPTLAGLDGVAMARSGGGGGGGAGGATGADSGIQAPDRIDLPPRGGRGQIVYTNEFPEDDPPIIIIPFPRRSAAPTAVGQMEPCYQNHLRPNARILCERRAVRY
jgi:hypothetical protein